MMQLSQEDRENVIRILNSYGEKLGLPEPGSEGIMETNEFGSHEIKLIDQKIVKYHSRPYLYEELMVTVPCLAEILIPVYLEKLYWSCSDLESVAQQKKKIDLLCGTVLTLAPPHDMVLFEELLKWGLADSIAKKLVKKQGPVGERVVKMMLEGSGLPSPLCVTYAIIHHPQMIEQTGALFVENFDEFWKKYTLSSYSEYVEKHSRKSAKLGAERYMLECLMTVGDEVPALKEEVGRLVKKYS